MMRVWRTVSRSKKRAVSPVLSVIILMSLAVVGGVFLNEVSREAIVRGFQSSELKVTHMSLEKEDKTNACYLSLSLQNSGTKELSDMGLRATNDFGDHVSEENLTVNMPGVLAPGDQSESNAVFSGHMCGNFTLANSYSFRINASAQDESTFSTTELVRVNDLTSSGG